MKIDDPKVLHDVIDEYYLAYYYTKQYTKACEILKYFRKTHIDDHIIDNTDYLLPHIKEGKK